MLRLKLGKVKDPSGMLCMDDVLELRYTGRHNNGTTTLEFDVTVTEQVNGKFVADIRFDGFKPQENIEGALEKLAEWCERAAAGIREHKFTKSIPT